MIGQTLRHYRIDALIGAGAMGVVYKAWDRKLKRSVAIKILAGAPSGDSRRRLLEEARAAAALNHPHICTVHEVEETEDQPFIVMEHIDGQSLDRIIPPVGLRVATAIRYGANIAEALAHAHDRGVVHRDLKSANVMVTPDEWVKVLDFGLAKREEGPQDLTRSHISQAEVGVVAGTLSYMSPEVLRGGAADARSDIWGLGVLLYEMVSGHLPFTGQTGFELAAAILDRPPRPLTAKVPSAVSAVIERCLTKESQQRYQLANEVRVALESVAAAEPGDNVELERLFSFSPDLICIAGFDGFFKRLNPAWTATLGWSTQELLSKPWMDFVHPDDHKATEASREKLAAGEQLYSFENRYRCRDGSYRWLQWSVAILVDGQKIYAVARDVTERRRAEEQAIHTRE